MWLLIIGYVLVAIVSIFILAGLITSAPDGTEDEDGFRYV